METQQFVYLLDCGETLNDPDKLFMGAFKTKALAQAYSVRNGNKEDGILFLYHQGLILVEEVIRPQKGPKDDSNLWIIREVLVRDK